MFSVKVLLYGTLLFLIWVRLPVITPVVIAFFVFTFLIVKRFPVVTGTFIVVTFFVVKRFSVDVTSFIEVWFSVILPIGFIVLV